MNIVSIDLFRSVACFMNTSLLKIVHMILFWVIEGLTTSFLHRLLDQSLT